MILRFSASALDLRELASARCRSCSQGADYVAFSNGSVRMDARTFAWGHLSSLPLRESRMHTWNHAEGRGRRDRCRPLRLQNVQSHIHGLSA
ncbi:hypothetical protein ANO11243_067520 [Dothideomycetidae sp. 11243]|nr:hypothetical protein ANO11243_067520 [fungal sp. No.11243]